MMSRHTMGQDWGGRRPVNPEGSPTVTARQVFDLADRLGVKVSRGDFSRVDKNDFMPSAHGTWWMFDESETKLVTMGTTNYWALDTLNGLGKEKND